MDEDREVKKREVRGRGGWEGGARDKYRQNERVGEESVKVRPRD